METLTTLAQMPDADAALEQAAQFGELAYVLVLLILVGAGTIGSLGGALLKWVVIPGQRDKRTRDNLLADAQVRSLESNTVTLNRQTDLMAGLVRGQEGLREDHREFRDEVKDEFVKVHSKIDTLRRGHSGDPDPSQPAPVSRPSP